MIKLEALAEAMEQKLNAFLPNSNLNQLYPNTFFAFRVVLDTAEYKEPERDQNYTTYYINAIMQLIGSTSEGEDNDTYNSSVTTTCEFLIPLFDERDSDGNSPVVEEIRWILTTALQNGKFETVTSGDTVYLQGSRHRIANTGSRAIRERVGDSVTLSVYSEYVFVANGVASTAYKFYIVTENVDNPNEPVYTPIAFTSFAFGRKTTTEMHLADGDNAAKASPLNTILTLSFTSTVRNAKIDEIKAKYVMTGEIEPIAIKVESPNYDDPKIFTMIISDNSVAGQINLAAADSITLVEYQAPIEE